MIVKFVMKLKKKSLFWSFVCSVGLILLSNSATSADWTYTAKRGDTLYKISRRVGVPLSRLKQVNGLGDYIRIGQRINIPTGSSRGSAGRAGGSRVGVNTYLLARLIHAEAEAEPYVGKVAVGAVVLNRVESPKFPNTLAGVLYQPHAFESVTNGRVYTNPSSDSVKAARDAINGWDPSGGSLFFFNPAKPVSRWIWSRRIINRLGKHVFGL